MEGFTLVDAAVAGVILVSAVLAFARGFVREVLSIAGWILAQQLSPAPAALNIFAVALFLTLYLIQAQILANPAGALAKRLYPLAFAGFSLDEHFTRLTFRVWPPRPLHPVAPTHGDRQ